MFHNFSWKNKNEIKNLIEISLQTYMDKAVEWYLIILLLIYPLLLCKFKFFSISLQTNLLCITSLIIIAIYFKEVNKDKFFPRRVLKQFDFWALGIFVFNVGLMIVKIIRTDIFYEPSLIMIALSCMYFILSRAGNFYKRYFYYLILAAIIPLCAVLFHFFINVENRYFIDMILKDSATTAAYALLILVVAVLLYCTEKEKELKIFSGFLVGMASVVLFLQKNVIAVWIGGILFLLIPILFVPTGELIKRKMQMAFLYFFALSNMPLLTNYTKLLKKEVYFDLTSSIYIDLIIAMVGLAFFAFWEKIPKDTNLEEITFYKIRKTYRTVLAAVIITFLMLAFAGNSIQNIPEFIGQEKLVEFATTLQKGYWYQEGGLYAAIKEFGIIGAICFITLLAMIIVRVKKNYDRKETVSAMLTTLCIIFFIQSIFFKPSTLVTPIYFVFVIFTIYNKKKKRVLIGEEKENEEQEDVQDNMETVVQETELDVQTLEMFDING